VGLLLISTLTVVLVVCTGKTIASVPPSPAALPTPARQDAREVSLQIGDLPPTLVLCPESGEINHYLQLLQAGGSPSYEVTANEWTSLRESGAEAGWVSSFTQNPADCDARLGERQSASAVSYAIRFKTTAAATGAFKAGFLGLRPAPGLVLPGLTEGERTTLGPDSWVYDQTAQSPSVWVAYWARRDFVLFLFAEHLTPSVAQGAATGMDQRVR